MHFWWFENGEVFSSQGFSEVFMRRAAEENPDIIVFATIETTDIFKEN